MRKVSLVGTRFSALTVVRELTDGHYECLCDCGKKTESHKCNLRNGNTKSCGCLRSIVKMGRRNPQWKGDSVGYNALHEWMRKRYTKPALCENCNSEPPMDLANKSNKYLRDLSDWWYLCRRCHMTIDGRILGIRRGRS